jgi:putative transposase
MKYNPSLHHRRSIRLRGYDYAQPGEYFITLRTHDLGCVLGTIRNEEMILSEIGTIVKEEWLKTPIIRPNTKVDEFTIMPNHLHGIIVIDEERKGVPQKERIHRMGEQQFAHTIEPTPFRSPSGTVGAIIRGFKSASTNRINELGNTHGKQFWHRNYYEHVIRDEKDLERIREYIRLNPTRWPLDEENPNSGRKSLNNEKTKHQERTN